MPPLVLTPIQSGQGLPDCVYNARLVFARTFSLWKHHNLILVPQSTPSMRRPIPVKNWFCFFL
jgi:hypothetical protein